MIFEIISYINLFPAKMVSLFALSLRENEMFEPYSFDKK